MDTENLSGMYTRLEVAQMMNIHPNTLRAYMKMHGIEIKHRRLSVREVKRIFQAIGMY
ncbi:hypothetical protein [Persicobacter diffluens]|uniref:DNA-binding protein n=1 Tax=Persicobacter diffluens TaxID=981 RepID=A0AAN5AQL3_9BACT|nr:hypothetical protein PEDI_55300 [Persicobacter diffluens]